MRDGERFYQTGEVCPRGVRRRATYLPVTGRRNGVLTIGKKVKDRYYLLEKLGDGGEGTVYLARDEVLGKYWAVKRVPAERREEMEALRELSHSMLPQIVDYVQEEGQAYLVMEYISGVNLRQLRQRGPCPRQQVISWGIRLCQVLAYLHSRKPPVIHADVKPSNLLLSESQELYLIDLGSCVRARGGVAGCRGTPGYAAPEQARGRADCSWDIYSLGRTLEVLVGGQKCAGGRFWKVLKKCQKPSVQDRYRDCEEIQRELDRLLDGNGSGIKRKFSAKVAVGLAGVSLLGAVAASLRQEAAYQEKVLVSPGQSQQKEEFLDLYTQIQNQSLREMFTHQDGVRDRESLERCARSLEKLRRDYTGLEEQKILSLAAARVYRELGESVQAKESYERVLKGAGAEEERVYSEYRLYLTELGE